VGRLSPQENREPASAMITMPIITLIARRLGRAAVPVKVQWLVTQWLVTQWLNKNMLDSYPLMRLGF
jgi:hypothetical protein